MPKASLVTDQRLQMLGPPGTSRWTRPSAAGGRAPRPPSPTVAPTSTGWLATARRPRPPPANADPAVLSQLSPLARRTGWAGFYRLSFATPRSCGVLAPAAVGLGRSPWTSARRRSRATRRTSRPARSCAAGVMNPQIAYGEDVIGRLTYAVRHPGGAELAGVSSSAINELSGRWPRTPRSGGNRSPTARVVGNTAMHHLLLALPTRQLAVAPFVAATSARWTSAPGTSASSLAPVLRSTCRPCIGGFVGADHVAMILATDLDRGETRRGGRGHRHQHRDRARRPPLGHLDVRVVRVRASVRGRPHPGRHAGRRRGDRGGPVTRDSARAADDRRTRRAVGISARHRGRDRGALPDRARSTIADGSSATRRACARTRRGLEVVLAAGRDGQAAGHRHQPRATSTRSSSRRARSRRASRSCSRPPGTTPESVDEVVVAGAFGTYLNLDSALDIGLLPRFPQRVLRPGRQRRRRGRQGRAALGARTGARPATSPRGTGYVELTTYPGLPAPVRALHAFSRRADVPRSGR